MSNLKKIFFITLANLFLFIFIEITLTFFFVFHKAKNKVDFFQKDGFHLNLQGNQVIANKIFEDLVSNQLIKK